MSFSRTREPNGRDADARRRTGNANGRRHKDKFAYAKYLKRPLDFILALFALVVLSPLLLVLSGAGAIALKENPFFKQPRPGRDEKIFYLYKLRTMTNAKDENEELLPDDERTTPYGRFIRGASLDELPSLINVLKGELALVGPRPQLVRDMVFMTPKQRSRHLIAPGLTGLAQANGRNAIGWDVKPALDLKYLDDGVEF